MARSSFGVWFRLTSQITAFDCPRRFVDEQTSGPFRFSRHEHTFDEGEGGVTVMVDRITVASPVFGRIAEQLVLIPYLRKLIAQRNGFLLAALDERRS